MEFASTSSPFISGTNSVTRVMAHVIIALIPGIIVITICFGWGTFINLIIACSFALACEISVLLLRRHQIKLAISDLSVIVTAMLLALALPPLTPWWMTFVGVGFAVIIGKQLYGGLGYNPFNPAMVAYAAMIIAFPLEMSMWLAPAELSQTSLSFGETARIIFNADYPGAIQVDALTMATPLTTIRIQQGLGDALYTLANAQLFGVIAGKGWQWLNAAFLVGGVWLIYRRIISWHIPVSLLAVITVGSGVLFLIDSAVYPSPLFHLFSGGTMLCAFFIATDPVTASTTPIGRLWFGAGIGMLILIIRNWGGYPDGIAFAVLLMNMIVPILDDYTRPRVFGHQKHKS